MSAMSRRELRNVVAIIVVGFLVLAVAGYRSWGPWPQLLAGIAVMVMASFAAPVAFGWRVGPPRDRKHAER